MNAEHLDHYYVFGDVYETLDTCHVLETLLSRLRRQGLIDDESWASSKANIAEIRERLEHRLPAAS